MCVIRPLKSRTEDSLTGQSSTFIMIYRKIENMFFMFVCEENMVMELQQTGGVKMTEIQIKDMRMD